MLYEQNTLMHYGIKGQKWGVRRFQEENGTLTAAGKERYRKNSDGQSATGKATAKSVGGDGATGGLSPGMKYVAKEAVYNLSGPAMILARQEHRRINAKKELKEFDLNNEKHIRVSDKELKQAVSYRRKARREIFQRMKDNPETSFSEAAQPTRKKEVRRLLAKTAIINLAAVASYFAMQSPKVRTAMQNAVRSLAKKAARRKMNAVELRSDEYSVSDVYDKLSAGRR